MEIPVGSEKAFQLYASLYNNGDAVYRSARVDPREVTFTIGKPGVMRVEVREGGYGLHTAYLIGTAKGRSTLGAQLRDDPKARSEVIMDVR